MSSAAGLSTYFRDHARYCDRAGAPLYGVLLRGMADDLDAHGVMHRLCAGWEGRPRGVVVQLRVFGALHRIVLQRRAPLLATYYRTVGGEADPATAWPVARDAIEEHLDEIAAALEVAPQTNEVGRAAALAAGLSAAARAHGLHQVRLLEIGASAGLNLLVDRFRVTSRQGWQWGPADSPVQLTDAVDGPVDGVAVLVDGVPDGDPGAPAVQIVARRGCDLSPVDPLSAQGRLRLSSFVWPDHVDRFQRLAGALDVAALAGEGAAPVDRAEAGRWLTERLSDDGGASSEASSEASPGAASVAAAGGEVLTVVWHSVFWQYLDDETRAVVLEAIAGARRHLPLAHLRLESPSAPHAADLELWLDDVRLGGAPAHGVPLRLVAG